MKIPFAKEVSSNDSEGLRAQRLGRTEEECERREDCWDLARSNWLFKSIDSTSCKDLAAVSALFSTSLADSQFQPA